MIKIVFGYKVKKSADIRPLLLKLRSHAVQFPGFISDENLASETDSSIILVLTTWENVDAGLAWQKSTITQKLLQEAKALLDDGPKVTLYTVEPTVRWV